MNNSRNLRQRILSGEQVVGTFFKINSPDVAEIIGAAGFDFIIIDTEHGNFSDSEVANIVRAADGVGLNSIVRVRTPSEEDILHALDSGASGVQIPGLADIETAKKIAASTKYCPDGTRGLSLTVRSARYGIWKEDKPYVEYANEQSLVAVHVENIHMAERIDELCAIPQIDVIFVGPADLSQSMGIPGKLNDPKLKEVVARVFERARAAGKAVGIFCGTPEAVHTYRQMGATYILYSSDTTILYRALSQALNAFGKE